MGRAKDQWIELTGGFQIGETPEMLADRAVLIHQLTEDLKTGKHSLDEADAIITRIQKLKGLSSDEFPSYEEMFEDDDD